MAAIEGLKGRGAGNFVTAVTVVSASTMIGFGAWMRVDPAGFARWANWPNHAHFLHDAGVFQLGIGLMMLSALWWRDAVAVALAGFLFANTFHGINHALDSDLGGNDSDPWALGLVSVLAAAGLLVRLRLVRSQRRNAIVRTDSHG
ncbi:hypothetical protein [Nocardia amamiensis]|uniref:hypothetical protein n=1 Tax=Nocardia amamiensis TaxID=404578 RepID=UPI0033E3753A